MAWAGEIYSFFPIEKRILGNLNLEMGDALIAWPLSILIECQGFTFLLNTIIFQLQMKFTKEVALEDTAGSQKCHRCNILPLDINLYLFKITTKGLIGDLSSFLCPFPPCLHQTVSCQLSEPYSMQWARRCCHLLANVSTDSLCFNLQSKSFWQMNNHKDHF